MASENLVEIPDGSYQLTASSQYHLVILNGKAFLAPSGPSKPISDLFPSVPAPVPAPPEPPRPPAPPGKVSLFLKAHWQQLLIGVLAALVLVLAFMHFSPSGPVVPPQPKPTPRPPWIPPNPPEPPAPTPNPRIRESQTEDPPTAEPGPDPIERKKAR